MAESRSGVPLVDELAALLRERIYQRRYPGGSVLAQAPLAAELGVSRTPLREALRVLQGEGLVRTHGGGATVVLMDPAALASARQLREVVEGLAARLAATRDDRAVDGLERALADADNAAVHDSTDRRRRIEVDFHGELLLLSGNSFVREQLPLVRRTEELGDPVQPGPTNWRRRHGEHLALVDAVRRGDAVVAEALARAHISGV